MDAKNLEALSLGPEYMLAKIANLGPGAHELKKTVGRFKEAYGELYPGMNALGYWACAESIFREAWEAETTSEKELISADLTALLERHALRQGELVWNTDDPTLRPAMVANFASGTIELRPRTLLDWLVKSLLEYRDKLATCQRKFCLHPYFVRTHPRQQFCSDDCAQVVRAKKKEKWWDENRERFIEKWRKERKAVRKAQESRKRGR